MQSGGTVHDPLHGHVTISRLESLLIGTREVQRLRRIQQLGLADIAFPGANHTRFEHSIGTMHVADMIARTLGLDEREIQKVRAAALLHDVGHSAFSHSVEAVLARNPTYAPQIGGRRFYSHEMFTRHIVENNFPMYDHIAEEVRSVFGVDASSFFFEVAAIATGDVEGADKPYLAQIVSGDIDADRLDFLMRDSYHTGVSLGLVDVEQIVGSLALHDDRMVLGGSDSYSEDMTIAAAESMLIARSHHYSAIIHNPLTQSVRAMLLRALEDTLDGMEDRNEVLLGVSEFFTTFNDGDLLEFIGQQGPQSALYLLQRIREGRICPTAARFNQQTLKPGLRMALSTIARNGVAEKMFERELSKRLSGADGGHVLIDLSVAGGVPKSTRILRGGEEQFLYDESALANGLVRAISRQISLCVFAEPGHEEPGSTERDLLDRIEGLSPDLLRFIRNEEYLNIEGVMLVFYCLHNLFSDGDGSRVVIPRIRNITCLYRLVRKLAASGRLGDLLDYRFHDRYGFMYSDGLFEDIQILVAMGLVDEDLRYYDNNGQRAQRYEYVLTAEGVEYGRGLALYYKREMEKILEYLKQHKHEIPRDMVTIYSDRYNR